MKTQPSDDIGAKMPQVKKGSGLVRAIALPSPPFAKFQGRYRRWSQSPSEEPIRQRGNDTGSNDDQNETPSGNEASAAMVSLLISDSNASTRYPTQAFRL
jgi:hypothetical protein